MGSRISEKPERLFEVFLEIAKPEGSNEDPFIIQQFPTDYNEKDTLAMVPKFAYPCVTDASNVDHFTFVLTDLDSMFRFGFCRHSPGHQTCLCLLSCLPWCEVFFKMLDQVAEITNRTENNIATDFLQTTYNHEIPLPKIPVTIVANEDMFSFTSPDPNLLPSIPSSRNLTEYYNAVDPSNMMRIFASMLQERRIYMTSKKLSRLTACIHAAESLIYPMHWQHLYIPVLPSHLIDYISAPMPYLIGVHSNLVEKLTINRVDVADAVIVDLDANTVTSEYDDLEAMPEEVSSYLKKNLKPDVVKNSMLKDGDAISRAFLHALVRLIGGYRAGLKIEGDDPITFDPERFVHSRSSQTMQNYLEGMLALQTFQQFIYGRLEILNRGGGFVDLFEQQANMYEDKLTSQSSYKEWVRNVKKGGRKGREVLNGLKVKAKPAFRMSTATVKSVKVQGKKAVADIKTRISNQFNDDDHKRHSTFHATGGIVHSRRNKRASKTGTQDATDGKPPRPPLPSNRTESNGGGRVLSSHDSQDDSQLRLSYHQVDMSLMQDRDIQAAMMRSASAEALPKFGILKGSSGSSSSSLSSCSVDDTDGANIPFGNLPSSDEDIVVSTSQMTLASPHPPPPPSKSAEASPITGDRLIRARPSAQAPGRPSVGPQIISQPPVAPPRNKKNKSSPSDSPVVRRHLPPTPQTGSSLLNLAAKSTNVSQAPATEPTREAMLIKFESSESETTPDDIFDPLSKSKSTSESKSQNRDSSNLDFIMADDDDGQEVEMRKLERNNDSRSSLSRSKAFRRESQKGPVRQSHVGDDENESDDDGGDKFLMMSSKEDCGELVNFDPLSDLSSVVRRTSEPHTSSMERKRSAMIEGVPARGRAGSDLMKSEWSLASLASSPRVFLPSSSDGGRQPFDYSTRNLFQQPRAGLVKQSTLPATNTFQASAGTTTAGGLANSRQSTLRSQASIPSSLIGGGGYPPTSSSLAPATAGQHSNQWAGPPPQQQQQSTGRGPSPTLQSLMGNSSLLSSNSRGSSPSHFGTGLGASSMHSSVPLGQRASKPVQSPFFNSQGGSPMHSQRNTMSPSSFAGPSASFSPSSSSSTGLQQQQRSSYAASATSKSLSRNTPVPKQNDPFGDLVNLGFGNTEKKPVPHQSQEVKASPTTNAQKSSQPPPRPPAPSWETFD